jgi:chemotaxis protein MotB
MKKSLLSMLLIASAIIFTSSCVPGRKLDECEARYSAKDADLSAFKAKFAENEIKLKELGEKHAALQIRFEKMKIDSITKDEVNKGLAFKYEKLNAANDQLLARYDKLMAGNEAENKKLSGDLQMTQEQLIKKQDELKSLEALLNKQKLEQEGLMIELKKRETRVNELEEMIKKKDQASADLKKKLSEALFNFENKGLTITQKDGKIYVSMDESLLFASGKTDIQPKGIEALKGLAKVMEQNTDINILVEGHTDNIPMAGKGDIKDNWDLSVMRATSVTKIILQNAPSLDKKRITAAGRGEFYPIDPAATPEARKKNRRTEIILEPKLDELLKVLGGN